MSNNKEIYKYLLQGFVIRTRHNRSVRYSHCLYDGQKPVVQISVIQFNNLSPLLKEKKGNYTLNLNEVRKLNGNCLVKRMYKSKKK